MDNLGLTLVWCAIQVTIFGLAAAVLYLLLRKRSPAARSTVLISTFLSVILLSVMAWSPWPRWVKESEVVRSPAPVTSSDSPSKQVPISDAREGQAPQNETADGTTLLFLNNLWDEMKRAPVPVSEQPTETWSWQAVVAWCFLIGLGIGTIRLLTGLLAVRKYSRTSLPIASKPLQELLDTICTELGCVQHVSLRESETVSSPATIGWRKPLILLPLEWKQWSIAEQRAVLAHEVAHICRFDFPAWFAAQLGLVLHFYHPVVHWLAGRLRLEQELAADAAAAEVVGGNTVYLQTLAGMAIRRDDRSMNWAARTFLPTHHTLIRRIEMLRRKKPFAARLSSAGRFLLSGAMLCAAVFAAGLRSPFEEVIVAQEKPATTEKPIAQNTRSETEPLDVFGAESADGKSGFVVAQNPAPLSLAYVPRDAIFVAAMRPNEMLSKPVFARFRDELKQRDGLREFFGISLLDVSQVTVSVVSGGTDISTDGPSEPMIVLQTNKPIDQPAFLKHWLRQTETADFGGMTYHKDERGRACCYFANNNMVIFAYSEGEIRRAMAAGSRGADRANWANEWKRVADDQAGLYLSLERIRPLLNAEFNRGGRGGASAMVSTISPLWQNGNQVVLGASASDSLDVHCSILCQEGTAQNVADTFQALVVLGRNGLSAARNEATRSSDGSALMVMKMADLADEVLDQVKVTTEGNRAVWNFQIAEEAGDLATAMFPVLNQARAAAKRTQSTNNLRQIGLAFHNYHDVYNHFPPAVVIGPDGKTPHSWRVAILPYLDQAALYNQYHLDEPWDSEHNLKIAETIVPVYQSPMDDRHSANSSYFALIGKDTALERKEGTTFRDITDGTSNTIMVVESKQATPWTKPEDIEIDLTKELPKFGGLFEGGFLALIADGSVKFISEALDKQTLKHLIQRNDGNSVRPE